MPAPPSANDVDPVFLDASPWFAVAAAVSSGAGAKSGALELVAS
jgi:hypothetical protein